MAEAIGALAQKLDSIDHEVGSLHERARLLLDEAAAKVSALTNRRLFTLSILTACLLPPTLVTGFFGMNTKDMPFQNTDGGTWLALLVAFAAGARQLLGAAPDAGAVEQRPHRPCATLARRPLIMRDPRLRYFLLTKESHMILEIAQIDVKPGMEAEFESGVAKAAPLVQARQGLHRHEPAALARKAAALPAVPAMGRRWKTTPKISAVRPTGRNGASWSGTCFAGAAGSRARDAKSCKGF